MHLASSLSRVFVVSSAAAVSLGAAVLLHELSAVGSAREAQARRAAQAAVGGAVRGTRGTAATAARAMPRLPEVAEDANVIADDGQPHVLTGLAPITDPAEFAMVITIDGRSYLRLSTLESPSRTTGARMIRDGEITAVIADLPARGVAADFASWRGREVLVDGTCAARVTGFAELSRAYGNPEGTWTDDDDGGAYTPGAWTKETLRAANVTLVATLDGCTGTWARASSHAPAVVIARVEDADTAREAERALLATRGGHAERDPRQQQWQESGGAGAWQDAVTITTDAFEHTETGERWIFARAVNDGGCGEPSVATMAAYRVDLDGRMEHVTDMDLAHSPIDQLVDLDGNGEPEIISGATDAATLFDLTGESHDSIYTPSYAHEGCGC